MPTLAERLREAGSCCPKCGKNGLVLQSIKDGGDFCRLCTWREKPLPKPKASTLSRAECERSLAGSKKAAIETIRKNDFRDADRLIYQANYWLLRAKEATA